MESFLSSLVAFDVPLLHAIALHQVHAHHKAQALRVLYVLTGGFVTIDIDPQISEAEQIMALLSPRPQLLRAERDFPAIMAHIKQEYEKRFGKGVDKPYQDAVAAN